MQLSHPPALARVTVHKAAPIRRALVAAVLIALYGASVTFVYSTIGEPYRIALEAAERADEERFTALDAETAEEEAPDASANTVSVDVGAAGGLEEVATATPTPKVTITRKPASAAESFEAIRDSEASEFSSRHLPSPYMADTWAVAALCFVITLHALYHLLCRWLVWFKVASLYQPSPRIGASLCPLWCCVCMCVRLWGMAQGGLRGARAESTWK